MIQIDSAIGNEWEELGRVIEASGNEDASGSRRHYFDLMQEGRFTYLTCILNVTEDRAREIYAAIVEGEAS